MSENGCQIADNVGILVQTSLAGLVIAVLSIEYLFEIIKSLCCPSTTIRRSFSTFWFDSYKICSGALVSHFFNIAVSYKIDESASNQCAVYAVAFYYIACSVPYVQLLQYGVIQYAVKMAYHSQLTMNNQCRQRWLWISKPGIYDANRFPVNDCLRCRQCGDREAQCNYIKILLVMVLAVVVSVLSFCIGYKMTETPWYIDVSLCFLVCVFLLSTAIAPVSCLWQTMQWVLVKSIQKLLFSIFAITQAKEFAEWSLMISTGDDILDAWLYMAILPIIENVFMFLMYSRISRLKLPCFTPKYTETIDKERSMLESDPSLPMLDLTQTISDDYDDIDEKTFDKKEACKLGIVFMLIINGTLLVIATTFLGYNGVMESIWILFLSMIVVPSICSVLTIYLFSCFVDKNIHVCGICCMMDIGKGSMSGVSMNQTSIYNSDGLFMDLDDLVNIRKL